MRTTTKDDVINEARGVLTLDPAGFPVCDDSLRIFIILWALECLDDEMVVDELVTNGFLLHSADRYQLHIATHLKPVAGSRYEMGTEASRTRHFCGETPRHAVDLTQFMLAEHAVTHEIFALLDPRRLDLSKTDRNTPVANVTWFDAAVFARWVGCRLPTEAEWEFACGAGTREEWSCAAADLPRYAWYSENANRHVHPVGYREPNSLGLFDMHGNVWEWCRDWYDRRYYRRGPR